MNNPGEIRNREEFREVTFDKLKELFGEQASGDQNKLAGLIGGCINEIVKLRNTAEELIFNVGDITQVGNAMSLHICGFTMLALATLVKEDKEFAARFAKQLHTEHGRVTTLFERVRQMGVPGDG